MNRLERLNSWLRADVVNFHGDTPHSEAWAQASKTPFYVTGVTL